MMRRRLLYTLLALAAAAAVIGTVEPLRTALTHVLHGDVDALQAQLRSLGVWGGFVVVALILAHAVIFFPAEIVNATAGLAFGFWVAFPLVLLAWFASGLIAYWLGRIAGRPLAVRLAGERRVATAEGLIDRSGAPALLSLRRENRSRAIHREVADCVRSSSHHAGNAPASCGVLADRGE